MYYIRIYNQAKWHQYDFSKTSRISAETITIELKSKKNSLSLWKVENIESLDKEKGLIASIGTMQALDKFDIIIFTEEELKNLGISLENTLGESKYFPEFHVDMVNLDLDLLSKFAILFATKLNHQEQLRENIKADIKLAQQKRESIEKFHEKLNKMFIRRYTKEHTEEVIQKAISSKIINS